MPEYFDIYKREVNIPRTEGLPQRVIETCREYEGEGGDYMTMGPMVQEYAFIHPETGEILCESAWGTMPDWWKPPSESWRAQNRGEKRILLTTNNVVTLIVKADDSGKLVMQLRGYLTAEGKPVSNAGKLSLHGGVMEEGESPFDALAREVKEELGIEIVEADVEKIFDHYDADMGRVNEVYELLPTYRHMLGLLESSPEPAIDALMNPEGVGRVFIDENQLNEAMIAGNVTSISVAIIQHWVVHRFQQKNA